MPKRRWTVRVEGDVDSIRLLPNGVLLVSTTRRIEKRDGTVSNVRFVPHRCYAIAADGTTAWVKDGLAIRGEAPDGALHAIDTANRLVILEPSGAVRETREVPDPMLEDGVEPRPWTIAGWDGDAPVITRLAEALWIAPHLYTVEGLELRRHDREGDLVASFPLDRAKFEALREGNDVLAHLADDLAIPGELHLAHDAKRGRLLAYREQQPGWIASLTTDGEVEWVTLATINCCNGIARAGDALVYTSGCGELLAFLGDDGAITVSHQLADLRHAFVDGDTIWAVTTKALHAFTHAGEAGTTLGAPAVRCAKAHAGVLYLATDAKAVSAYDMTV